MADRRGKQLAGSQGDGEFEAGRGEYDAKAYSLSGYLRYRSGDSRASVDAVVGRVDYDITRRIQLGQAVRFNLLANSQSHAPVQAGPFCCAPSRSGLVVRFLAWRSTPADASLHE